MTEEAIIKTKENIIEFLKRFPFYKYAAKANFIDADTLLNWRNADDNFSARCEAARTEGIQRYANKANPEFMLACAVPEDFGKKNDTNVNVNFIVQRGDNGNQTSEDQCVRTDETTPETTGSAESSRTV